MQMTKFQSIEIPEVLDEDQRFFARILSGNQSTSAQQEIIPRNASTGASTTPPSLRPSHAS
jgi:hypothetical protein